MPVRRIPKNYMTVTGVASSAKSEELIGYEGRLEFYLIKLASFNNNVARCEEQPVRVTFRDADGKVRSYTLDFRITYREDLLPKEAWRPLLVEVKPRGRLFKKLAEFRPKFRAASRYAKSICEDFTIITDEEICRPYLKNVLFLLKFRSYPVDQVATNLLLSTLSQLGETNPHTLLITVTDDQSRRGELLPTLWQLIANRTIGVDLEEPLAMTSPINCPAKGGASHESIREFSAGSSHRKKWQALRYFKPFGS